MTGKPALESITWSRLAQAGSDRNLSWTIKGSAATGGTGLNNL